MKFRATGFLVLAAIAGCSNNHPVTTVSHNSGEQIINPNQPLTANTRFAAGQVAESQGDFPRAISQYKQSIQLDPKASVPLLRLGMIYTSLHQYDDALEVWKQYVKVTNGAAAGYCNMGLTLELAGRFQGAEEAYKTAIAKEPKNEAARVNYGLMLARENRIPEATEQLQAVLTPAEAHYNLASVLESEGKIQAARGEYQVSLRLDPDLNDAKARLAALDGN
jgi:tetratricopeptide (TPR) repeat protein